MRNRVNTDNKISFCYQSLDFGQRFNFEENILGRMIYKLYNITVYLFKRH